MDAALEKLAFWHRRRFELPVVAIHGSSSIGGLTTSLLRKKKWHVQSTLHEGDRLGVLLALLGLEARHRAAVIGA